MTALYILLGLGSSTFVPMMQPANLRHSYFTPQLRRLHSPPRRCVLLQRQVRPTLVIILEKQLQRPTQWEIAGAECCFRPDLVSA